MEYRIVTSNPVLRPHLNAYHEGQQCKGCEFASGTAGPYDTFFSLPPEPSAVCRLVTWDNRIKTDLTANRSIPSNCPNSFFVVEVTSTLS